ncbi:BNR repeat domain protein [Labilithrix luteola]|uniref:BNR repeat domain protein n=1 Tax=Labilithrix luteola TaxID=1391654 RepID=A0A0K1QES3_9BACT|nr:hypothetical protein [Labilithrix luteola]AKV03935.1 BNR repeat domain protein [Labilithrix luteola]
MRSVFSSPPPRLFSVHSLGSLVRAAVMACAIPACANEGVLGSFPTGPPDAGSATASNEDANAGNGIGPEERAPLPASAPIAIADDSTCVKTSDATVVCWGNNASCTLGNGALPDEIPMSREPVAASGLDHVRALFGGAYAYCALRDDGRVFCWGDMFFGDLMSSGGTPLASGHLPVTPPFEQEGLGEVAQLAVGRFFVCALQTTGELRCWGENDRGQLGDGTQATRYLPTTISSFDGNVVSVSASMGGAFACATTSRGSVYCWGDDRDGQISAVGKPGDLVLEPLRIDGLPEPALDVAVGAKHACARLQSGTVACWGDNQRGQLGIGTTATMSGPVQVLYLSDVVQLTAGASHTCAVRSEGSVICWGDDANGQSGSRGPSTRPQIVVEASFGARSVACGSSHSCAWGEGGKVRCWGADTYGQLGASNATF